MPASRESSVNTLAVPPIGDQNPAILIAAVDHAFRLVVDNVGSNAVLLAFDPAALTNEPAIAKTYYLRAGRDQTFVLQPGQRMYAAGEGDGGQVSIAASVAVTESFGS